jgi:hypothetical protein
VSGLLTVPFGPSRGRAVRDLPDHELRVYWSLNLRPNAFRDCVEAELRRRGLPVPDPATRSASVLVARAERAVQRFAERQNSTGGAR